MTAPLDEKGLDAAKAWFNAEFNGLPDADTLTHGIIRAYLAALEGIKSK